MTLEQMCLKDASPDQFIKWSARGDKEDVIEAAAKHGRIDFLEWYCPRMGKTELKRIKAKNAKIIYCAMRANQFETVKWLFEAGFGTPSSTYAVEAAASTGNMELMEWVGKQNVTSLIPLFAAISSNSIEMYDYCAKLIPVSDKELRRLCVYASGHSTFEMLEHICPLNGLADAQLIYAAIYNNKSETFRKLCGLVDLTYLRSTIINDLTRQNATSDLEWFINNY